MLPRAVSGLTWGLPLKVLVTWEVVCKGDWLGILYDASNCVVLAALPLGENSALLSHGSTENVIQFPSYYCIDLWQQGSGFLACFCVSGLGATQRSHKRVPHSLAPTRLCCQCPLPPKAQNLTPWRQPLFCPPWSWIESILLLLYLLS